MDKVNYWYDANQVSEMLKMIDHLLYSWDLVENGRPIPFRFSESMKNAEIVLGVYPVPSILMELRNKLIRKALTHSV